MSILGSFRHKSRQENSPSEGGHQFRLLPDGSDSIVLAGYLEPTSETAAGVVLRTSPVTHRSFDPDDREVLQQFAQLQSHEAAVAVMKSIGGEAEDLDGWVSSGLLVRFPGVFTLSEFLNLSSGLTIVWGPQTFETQVNGEEVTLTIASTESALPISLHLFEVLNSSDGKADLPRLLRRSVPRKDTEALAVLVGELTSMLRFLVNAGLVSVIRAN